VRSTLAVPLAARDTFQFFSSSDCKILILLMLLTMGRRHSGQNIEPEGLTSKIFWNKELAVHLGPLFCADFGKVFAFLWLR
jgi:hypothetical protein